MENTDTLEKFYIFREVKKTNQINDQHMMGHYKISDAIAQYADIP
jgi:hypothetical protein